MEYDESVMDYIKSQPSTRRYVVGAGIMLPQLTFPTKSGDTKTMPLTFGYCCVGDMAATTVSSSSVVSVTAPQYSGYLTITIERKTTSASTTYYIPPDAIYNVTVYRWWND